MYLEMPEYSLIHMYLKELEKNLENGYNFTCEYKTYDKEFYNEVAFKCFDLVQKMQSNSIFIKNLNYHGTLEFSYNKATNEVYVLKVPYILINNKKLFIFTSDLAKIIEELLKKYVPVSDVSIKFSSSLSVLAMNKEVAQIIPNIVNTTNYQFLLKILEQIEKEISYIERDLEKQQYRAKKEDAKKEFVLIKRRSICGIDISNYDRIEDYFNAVNKALIDWWTKKVENYTIHLNATKKKYFDMYLSGDPDSFLYDMSIFLGVLPSSFDEAYERVGELAWYEDSEKRKIKKEIEEYLEARLEYDLSEEEYDSIISEINKIRKEYDREYNASYSIYKGPERGLNMGFEEYFAQSVLENDYLEDNPICSDADYDELIRFEKYIIQIKTLIEKIEFYKELIKDPDKAIINFSRYGVAWNAIMQSPYWLKLSRCIKGVNGHGIHEKIALLMVKPGTKTIDFKKMKKFNSDKAKNKKFWISDEYQFNKLIITIPKSLDYLEIIKLVEYGFQINKYHDTKAEQINFICEDVDTAVKVKEICIKCYLALPDTIILPQQLNFWPDAKMELLVNVDPDYYRNYFLDCPKNEVYYHRYDYSSQYKFRRKESINFSGKIDCAVLAFKNCGITPTEDMIKEIVLGGYDNECRFPKVKEEYEKLVKYVIEVIINMEPKTEVVYEKLPKIKNLIKIEDLANIVSYYSIPFKTYEKSVPMELDDFGLPVGLDEDELLQMLYNNAMCSELDEKTIPPSQDEDYYTTLELDDSLIPNQLEDDMLYNNATCRELDEYVDYRSLTLKW